MTTPAELQKMIDDFVAVGVDHLDNAIIAAVRELYLAAGDRPEALKLVEQQHAQILH
jgi:hypothetical protein